MASSGSSPNRQLKRPVSIRHLHVRHEPERSKFGPNKLSPQLQLVAGAGGRPPNAGAGYEDYVQWPRKPIPAQVERRPQFLNPLGQQEKGYTRTPSLVNPPAPLDHEEPHLLGARKVLGTFMARRPPEHLHQPHQEV